ncbi:MAG: hypothetical protein QM736_29905 [Vicinamibacterales bacterium]
MSLAITLGMDSPFAGKVITDGGGTLVNSPVAVSSLSYGDLYDTPFVRSAELGYQWSHNDEGRLRLRHTSATGGTKTLGTIDGYALMGRFEPYDTLGLEVGYRRYLTDWSSGLRTFAGAEVGLTKVDSISLALRAPAINLSLPATPLYKGSTVPTFAIIGGVRLPIKGPFAVEAAIALRGQGGLKAQDNFEDSGLSGLTDGSARWSLPLTVSGVFRF